ncbi:MAG: polyphosphate polymerase domain-containing protein [Erysipelotrichaceae bacterium]
MNDKSTFTRYEFRYLIKIEQKKELLKLINQHMQKDDYVQSIYNLYFDTNDYLLTRKNLAHPLYKEKIILRSYGKANINTKIFLEIKKSFNNFVYKHTFPIKERSLKHYITKNNSLECLYPNIEPKMFIGYNRESYTSIDNPDFRINFDYNIVYRDNDLTLCGEMYGDRLIPKGIVLMEIKSTNPLPLWITNFLNQKCIFETSFSKYSRAYQESNERKMLITYSI